MPIRDKGSKKADFMGIKGVLVVFRAYRVGKKILAGTVVLVPAKPATGYERAMDPDMIHAQRVFSSIPTVFESIDPTTRKWVDFTGRVEKCVHRLPIPERTIIRAKYMGPYVVSDQEAVRMVERAGLRLEMETFRSMKQGAMDRLSVCFLRVLNRQL